MVSKIVLLFLLVIIGVVNSTVNITVSGVSSGGAMAVQFHVAHSSIVKGAGIVAGIPYWCAQDDLEVALKSCMKYPDLISISDLIDATKLAYSVDSIDSPSILATSKVYLYSGTLDSVVNPGVVKKLLSYYQTFMPSENIMTEFSIHSDHAMVTNNFGNNCSYLGHPYINNCNYDAAGAILNFLYGKLKSPVTPIPSNIIEIDQTSFIPSIEKPLASLGPNAYLYVPTNCRNPSNECEVHVAFHGCLQTLIDVNTTFVTDSGYNGWAESNDIVVVYPQAVKSKDRNPEGCWDWWGYTGSDYASKLGVQIVTIKNLVDYVTQNYI